MELYDAALDMLFVRRDAERGITDLRLSRAEMTLLLQNIAYWLIRNGESDAAKTDVAGQIRTVLPSFDRLRAESAEAVLDQLLVRSGVLREPIEDRVDFAHKTFQEYLAAKAAIDNADIGALARNAHDDQWLQVAVLAVGHASPAQCDRLLQRILDRAEEEAPEVGERLHLVATACLEAEVSLDPELRDRIHAHAAELVPPRTDESAAALAKLGDFTLDLLARHPPRDADEAVHTVKCAAMIGTDAAIAVIERETSRSDDGVRRAIKNAWRYFDRAEYARRVISGLDEPLLEICDSKVAPALPHVTGRLRLSWVFPRGNGDISMLRDVRGLDSLVVLKDPDLRDLTPLRGHPSLTELALHGTGDLTIAPLTEITNLRLLDIDCLRRAHDPRSLQRCTGLTSLTLRDVPDELAVPEILPAGASLDEFGLAEYEGALSIETLRAMPQLHVLRSLDLRACPSLTTLDGVQAWNDTLRSVWLADLPGIRDIEPLRGLRGLTSLVIDNCAGLRGLEPIADLPALESLRLWALPPSLVDLGLLHAPNLRELDVQYTGDVDLCPLAGHTDLIIHVERDQRITGEELLGPGCTIDRSRF